MDLTTGRVAGAEVVNATMRDLSGSQTPCNRLTSKYPISTPHEHLLSYSSVVSCCTEENRSCTGSVNGGGSPMYHRELGGGTAEALLEYRPEMGNAAKYEQHPMHDLSTF